MKQLARAPADSTGMARKSNGRPVDLTVRILGQLREELRELRGEVGELRGEVGELRGEVGELRGEVGELRGLRGDVAQLRGAVAELRAATATGFRLLTARLENLRDVAGARFRDHERRLRTLEARRNHAR
jgi:predicted nuclease with TOPRIM domain